MPASGLKKTVVVTGVASGIGKATAALFHSQGWCVIGVDRQSDRSGGAVDHFIQADVAHEDDTLRAIEQVRGQRESVDALINNAAIQVRKPLVETTREEWAQTMRVNVEALYRWVKGLFPLLKDRDAAIVNVSSVHAVATSFGSAAYATSKGAVTAMTRALAIELAAARIRVNAVLPGAVDTPMLREGLSRSDLGRRDPDAALRLLESRVVLGRIGQPDEIAQAILFLADHGRSSYITGHALVVDGGVTARLSSE